MQPHVKDGLRLHFGQPKALHEAFLGLRRRRRRADQGHNLINMIERLEEALQDMGTGFGLAQFKLGAPNHHLTAMIEEVGQRGFEVQQHGPVVHHRQHVDAERGFQRRILVQRIDDDLRHGAALQLDDHADAPAVGLVAQVGHAVDLAVVDQRRDLFHEARLVQTKRDLPDDQGLEALLALLNLNLAAYLYGSAPSGIGVVQPLARVDVAARGEVRPLHGIHQILDGTFRVVDEHEQGIRQLAQIMRRDVRRHADGDA